MIVSCILQYSFLVLGCTNVALVGNGFCNDETNIADCNYDGGDCCAMNANTIVCCAAGYHPLVGNGFCNDNTNIAECEYDGGDCCGCVITEHCEDCACLAGELDDGTTNPLVGDGVCNDETNIVECNFDGGDCCVNLNTDSCSECYCLASGVITSPGFPGNYENNLDLTWLIQVQLGQSIQINFLYFNVEYYHSTCK